MLYHYVVFLEFFYFYFLLVQFVEPKFNISHTVFFGWPFFFIFFIFLYCIFIFVRHFK